MSSVHIVRGWILLGWLCCFATAAPAAAQAESGNTATSLPQVTVNGRREEDSRQRAHAFVSGLTHSGRFSGEALALWRVPVCFLIDGPPDTPSKLLLSRLVVDTDAAGARLGRRNCQPNFLVILTPDPDARLRDLKARHPLMLGRSQPAQVRRFLHPTTPRAVRVWHDAQEVDLDGLPLLNTDECGGLPTSFFRLDTPQDDVRIACTTRESRLSVQRMSAFLSVLVVVNTTLTRRATTQQLADYIALVGLADIDPGANVGDAPTILHLFTGVDSAVLPGLSDWDRAFLVGLYHTDQSSRGQSWEIEQAVVKSLP